jgi:hypothetical protein
MNRRIFGKDGNTPFPFQIIGVHDAIWNLFPFPKNARLFEECVNQGCFAVINVGNNSDVANGKGHRETCVCTQNGNIL